jgi:cardiolipin synthase
MLASVDLWQMLVAFWPHLLGVVTATLTVVGSCHAVLHKRDSRSAIAWVGIIWLAPILGTLLYVVFGINRIRRRAISLRGRQAALKAQRRTVTASAVSEVSLEFGAHIQALARLVTKVTQRALLSGNRLQALVNSDQAFPAMLAAIDGAERSITLTTYIFNNDPTGRRFVDALGKAVARGVQVRVLIDDIGARYTFPSIVGHLRKAKVPVARFLPSAIPGWSPYANLRSHRKIMVVDGKLGFTGGMNIREASHFKLKKIRSIQDLHCRVEGPVVLHLQQTFAEDWEFTTHEALVGDAWYPALEAAGTVIARGISDGPDEDMGKLRLTILGALACARTSVRIMTPYFLPDQSLITALNVAAMRGVEVDILLPEQSNLATVQWAATAQLWQVLERGCRVWLSPPPFEHTKLMLVDDAWVLLGSGNWDPRSLRLNFEFNVECYDEAWARQLEQFVQSKLEIARPVLLSDVDARKLPVRLRDGIARLWSPYL